MMMLLSQSEQNMIPAAMFSVCVHLTLFTFTIHGRACAAVFRHKEMHDATHNQ
jgi:hypothetical protein